MIDGATVAGNSVWSRLQMTRTRLIILLALGPLIGAALSMPPSGRAFAQAGSVGGTIGMRNKSVSGGSSQEHQNTNGGHKKSLGKTAPLSVGGKWLWTAKCDDGSEWSGDFDLTQDSDGSVSGTASGNDGSGSMTGRLVGRNLSVSRSYWNHSNRIVFTVGAGGNSLQGSEPSQTHGICKYQVKRS